jgi:hypothetical protein
VLPGLSSPKRVRSDRTACIFAAKIQKKVFFSKAGFFALKKSKPPMPFRRTTFFCFGRKNWGNKRKRWSKKGILLQGWVLCSEKEQTTNAFSKNNLFLLLGAKIGGIKGKKIFFSKAGFFALKKSKPPMPFRRTTFFCYWAQKLGE